MKLIFKQRLLSILDSYDIYDEFGNTEYKVKGEIGLSHRFRIYNNRNIELAYIKQSLFKIFPEFKMYINGNYVGCVKKRFSLLKPIFTVKCKGLYIEGDIFELNYKIKDNCNHVIASINKKLLSFSDKYVLNVKNREDVLHALVIVLSIDALKCNK